MENYIVKENTSINNYLNLKKQTSDFCLFKLFDLENDEDYIYILENYKKFIKEKYLYSYSLKKLNYFNYFSYYNEKISSLSLRISIDTKKGKVNILEVFQDKRNENITSKNLFSSNLGVIIFHNNDFDKEAKEFSNRINNLENKLIKIATDFIERKSDFYLTYLDLEKKIEIEENKLLGHLYSKFNEEKFFINFMTDINKYITLKDNNVIFRLFLTRDYVWDDNLRKLIDIFEIHFLLSDFELKRDLAYNFYTEALGILSLNSYYGTFKWKPQTLDNIKILKNKITSVKWMKQNLKKILIKQSDFENFINIK